MSEEITLKLYRTSDLTEAAALCTLGHSLQAIEVVGERATFVLGYGEPGEEFWTAVGRYGRGELSVEAREFARRRNEVAARMRRALAEKAAPAAEGDGQEVGAVGRR